MDFFSRYKDTPKYITNLAWKNRTNPTPQEEKLWQLLCDRKLDGLKFRRQFPIGRYIVDFYNHANRLVIEVDGGIHSTRKEYDQNRDDYLRACDYAILRFTNSEIDVDVDTVIQKIQSFLKLPLRGLGGDDS